MKNLIIRDHIVEPPTSINCFRELTFWVHYDYRHIDSIIIESEKENWDSVWKYLKTFGAFDFIYDFVRPEDKELGLRISDEFVLAPTIPVAYIDEKNVKSILRAVSYN